MEQDQLSEGRGLVVSEQLTTCAECFGDFCHYLSLPVALNSKISE